jgi:hypothetical protein
MSVGGLPGSVTLSDISTTFDAEMSSASNNFKTRCGSVIDKLISSIDAVPHDPKTSTDVFDRVIPAYGDLFDSEHGIYGDYVADITKSVDKVSVAVNNYIDALVITTQKELDDVQKSIDSLFTHVNTVVDSTNTSVSSLITSYSDRFTKSLNTAQSTAARYYINALTDSFVGSVKRAEDAFVGSINTVFRLYDEYTELPAEFVDDFDTIFTTVVTDYNNAIDKSIEVYNSGVSDYKYWSDDSVSLIEVSQSKVSSTLSSSGSVVSSLVDSIPSHFTAKEPIKNYDGSIRLPYSRVDIAFAVALSHMNQTLFNESVHIENTLTSLFDDISLRAEIVLKSSSRYFENNFVPSYLDSAARSNSRRSVLSGATDLVYDELEALNSLYNDRLDAIVSGYNNTINTARNNAVDYINDKIGGFTEQELAYITTKLTDITSSKIARVSGIVESISTQFNSIASGVTSHIDDLDRRYYKRSPLLRFTGSFALPSYISRYDDNSFSFEVVNIGGSPWVGWFGVILSGTDVEGGVITRRFNRRSGYITILPGDTRYTTLVIKGESIYNIDDFASSVSPTVIINTWRGVGGVLH